VRRVPKGKLVTVAQVRERLARDFQADFTCPLCSGIFLRISAEAAEEDRAKGKADITPYWRVVKDDGSLNDKFPGSPALQATRLQEEGYILLPGQGKKPPRVQDWERFLLKL
ncbi:MAG: MGMT family protein, partial [Chloroflexota bacterium]|nr:MGMT family protein [Chloroflexota bacterium]